MGDSGKLLVVEDDLALGGLMVAYLETAGFSVVHAVTAAQGFELMAREKPRLILLDLTLPDEDGLVVLRRLRQMGDVPVVIVSGRHDSDNRVAGLEMGADDFVCKPFVGRELVARVHGILRRAGGTRAERQDEVVDGLLLRLDDHRVVGREGEEIPLTPLEANILRALLHAGGRTLSRDQLMDAAGNFDTVESTRSIDVAISRLRAKLERDRKQPDLILTVQGIGYRLKL